MSMTRLLPVLLVGAASSLPLAAQRATGKPYAALDLAPPDHVTQNAPKDNVTHVPPLAKQYLMPQVDANPTPMAPKIYVLPGHVDMSKGLRNKSQTAQNEGTCYALREKRFRAPEAESDVAQPYASATCTPASGLHKKRADMESGK